MPSSYAVKPSLQYTNFCNPELVLQSPCLTTLKTLHTFNHTPTDDNHLPFIRTIQLNKNLLSRWISEL